MERVKIVLDADVIIHFSKGEMLSVLPQIFPEYDCIVLDIVYDELISLRRQLDNQIEYLKNIKKEVFEPPLEMKIEYLKLTKIFGKGESACMAYCRYTSNIIGSSNLRDIKKYCNNHKIVYLTTIDFLYYAWLRGLLTSDQCSAFIAEVKAKGSRLPDICNIADYAPGVVI